MNGREICSETRACDLMLDNFGFEQCHRRALVATEQNYPLVDRSYLSDIAETVPQSSNLAF
jgi:hypothetical protein